MSTDDPARLMRANQANWDARTPVHLASRFYGLDGDPDPERWFASFEWDDLGDLTGRDVLHLQCHLGTETLAFAQRGARATGLDFSEASVTAANDIAAKAGLDVGYVQANVYDAVEALGQRQFDVVYTGKGALCYLPDLPAGRTPSLNSCAPAACCTSSSSTPAQCARPETGPGRRSGAAPPPRLPGRRRAGPPGRDLHLHRRTGRDRGDRQLRVDARNRRSHQRVDDSRTEHPAPSRERRTAVAALAADGPHRDRLVAPARAEDPPPLRPPGEPLSRTSYPDRTGCATVRSALVYAPFRAPVQISFHLRRTARRIPTGTPASPHHLVTGVFPPYPR